LSRQVAGTAEVHWGRGGEHFVHATEDPTPFVRGLFEQYGDDVTDLEVRRASLEDTYIAMVQRFEAGDRIAPTLAEVTP
jgi:ABC-2 type transport system ATP-binding protein